MGKGARQRHSAAWHMCIAWPFLKCGGAAVGCPEGVPLKSCCDHHSSTSSGRYFASRLS